jgi:nicotinamide phosphoribosyltransferase
MNRDTSKGVAFKCSSINVSGEEREVFKRPITAGDKKSKAGRFKLIHKDGKAANRGRFGCRETDHLTTVFENGNLIKKVDF